MGNLPSSYPKRCVKGAVPLPHEYEYLGTLGEGGFGSVIHCLKRDTREHVAVKFEASEFYNSLQHEASMLRRLMCHNPDDVNIIKFMGDFQVNYKICLVFEKLDISLEDYLINLKQLMKLDHIQKVVQQLGVALDALKTSGIIHADIKLDNIMFVDQERQPFRMKLIDFGVSMLTSRASEENICQPHSYRAPELLLGLPFSEAIDIWSAACVIAAMMFHVLLFPGDDDYDTLRYTIDILGAPPDYLLDAALKSRVYFRRIKDRWRFKYRTCSKNSQDDRGYAFRSLDEMKKVCLEPENKTEAIERNECIELLKEMFQWDQDKRITPTGILNHPFITKSFLDSSSLPSPCDEPETPTGHGQTPPKECALMTLAEEITTDVIENLLQKIQLGEAPDEDPKINETLPPGVIMVRPAPTINRIHLEDTAGARPGSQAQVTSKETTSKKSETLSSDIISVESSDMTDDDDDDDADSEIRITETLPPGVIMVRPAPTINRIHLEDTAGDNSNTKNEPEPQSSQAQVTSKETTSKKSETLPSDIISVESSDMTDDDDDDDDGDDADSGVSSQLTETSASTLNASCSEVDSELTSITSGVDKKKKKKKKNCFKRFFSWMQKKFTSCCRPDVTDED